MTKQGHRARQGGRGSEVLVLSVLQETWLGQVNITTYIICHYDPLALVDELLVKGLGIVPAQTGAVVGVGHAVAGVCVNVALH